MLKGTPRRGLELLMFLLASGVSQVQISKIFGVTPSRVGQWRTDFYFKGAQRGLFPLMAIGADPNVDMSSECEVPGDFDYVEGAEDEETAQLLGGN